MFIAFKGNVCECYKNDTTKMILIKCKYGISQCPLQMLSIGELTKADKIYNNLTDIGLERIIIKMFHALWKVSGSVRFYRHNYFFWKLYNS